MTAKSDGHEIASMVYFLSRILASLLVCLALVTCSKPPAADSVRAPLCDGCNIVLISMDTVRADHLGVYRHRIPTSPNVDAFAERSLVFDNAISQSSWTLPSHASMMTGLYPGRLGVTHYPARRTIPESVPTLAEVLSEAGYRTLAFTGGGFVSSHFGFARGFDEYRTNGRRFQHNVSDAVTALQQNQRRRFFLFFHGYEAHRPYFSQSIDKQAVGIVAKGPPDKRTFCTRTERDEPDAEELQSIISYYDASIHMADRMVGRFLDELRELGLLENTVVLITSDHGEEFFEHGNCDHVRFLYHEIINVPFILYVPNLAPERNRIREIVPASISVARTLLDLVGIEHTMPGISLLPLIEGRRQRFGAVFSEADSIQGSLGSRGHTVSLTGRRYKLISYLEEGADEAYDLMRDRGETQVLPEPHAAYDARKTLRNWQEATRALPSAPPEIPRAATAPTATGETSPEPTAPGETRPQPTAPPASVEEPIGDEEEDEEELEVPKDIEEQLRSLGYVE